LHDKKVLLLLCPWPKRTESTELTLRLRILLPQTAEIERRRTIPFYDRYTIDDFLDVGLNFRSST